MQTRGVHHRYLFTNNLEAQFSVLDAGKAINLQISYLAINMRSIKFLQSTLRLNCLLNTKDRFYPT